MKTRYDQCFLVNRLWSGTSASCTLMAKFHFELTRTVVEKKFRRYLRLTFFRVIFHRQLVDSPEFDFLKDVFHLPRPPYQVARQHDHPLVVQHPLESNNRGRHEKYPRKTTIVKTTSTRTTNVLQPPEPALHGVCGLRLNHFHLYLNHWLALKSNQTQTAAWRILKPQQ